MYMAVDRKRWTSGEENKNDREREGGGREGKKKRRNGDTYKSTVDRG